MIKQTFEGIVSHVGPVKRVSNNSKYFRQIFILHIPKEEFRGVEIDEEFFVTHIISTSETDSRFLKESDKGTRRKYSSYIKGERWATGQRGDYQYNIKVTLKEWE